MPNFKPVDYNQTTMIPVDFDSQLLPGTFEHTLDYIIEKKLDLSIFNHRYKNDKTGASAYNPKILLKIVLLAYSRGIIYSRKIERLCQENIIFIALSCDTRPHFTTIAKFISKLSAEIESIFGKVLCLCDKLGLIGRDMFAIDGCKISSNASKEWSGTRKQFQKRQKKMEKVVRRILLKHKKEDENGLRISPDMRKAEEKQIETIQKKINKYEKWLKKNPDKLGTRNTAIQSNITDNESAKMMSSKGTQQGFCAVAVSDNKLQVISAAGVIGSGDERPMLQPMVKKTIKNTPGENPFNTAKFAADSGFYSESNLKFLYDNNIDAYVTDLRFRKRDERFKDANRYYPQERRKTNGKFTPADFIIDPQKVTCTCPAGKKMWVKSRNPKTYGAPVIQFQAHAADCKQCVFRCKCLRNENQKTARQFAWFKTHLPEHQPYTKRMMKKIDSDEGRYEYSKRLGTIEPVFGNLSSTLGLNRFSLRGKIKVSAQWLAFCLVHNIGKIQRYGMAL